MKSSENENLGLLQNLEFSIVQIWRAHPEMTDYTALRAYEAAFQFYRAEHRGHAATKPSTFKGLDAEACNAVKSACEYSLGRNPGFQSVGKPISPVSVETLLDALRQLMRSVERHIKVGGRTGYLTFIDQFLP